MQEKLTIDALLTKCELRWLLKDFPYLAELEVRVNPRMFSTLAYVQCEIMLLTLSSRILMDDLQNLKDILLHEFCHVINFREYQGDGHDKTFRQLMKKFGHHDNRVRLHRRMLSTDWVEVDGKKVIGRIDKGSKMLSIIDEVLQDMKYAA